jgi:hypothetical protein
MLSIWQTAGQLTTCALLIGGRQLVTFNGPPWKSRSKALTPAQRLARLIEASTPMVVGVHEMPPGVDLTKLLLI